MTSLRAHPCFTCPTINNMVTEPKHVPPLLMWKVEGSDSCLMKVVAMQGRKHNTLTFSSPPTSPLLWHRGPAHRSAHPASRGHLRVHHLQRQRHQGPDCVRAAQTDVLLPPGPGHCPGNPTHPNPPISNLPASTTPWLTAVSVPPAPLSVVHQLQLLVLCRRRRCSPRLPIRWFLWPLQPPLGSCLQPVQHQSSGFPPVRTRGRR